MRKAKMIGKKVLAYALTACLTAGLFTGINFTEKLPEVSAAETGFTSYDFLKCDGTNIKNNYGKGSNVYLRGTNAGGLFVQESWMNATNMRDQKTLMSDLTNRFGESTMYELLDMYEANYWTESDFDNCKNLGMSVIRLPFTYMNLYRWNGSDWVLRDNAFSRIDWFINECSERGIYVILDLHGAFGSQNGMDHSGEVIDNVWDVTFFSNDYNKNKTLELWRTVASRYAGNPAVAAYDTLNEPAEKAGTTNATHWAFYDQMYDTIRSVDPDHIIIMESCWGTGNLPNPNDYGWTNVMYEYHHYTWDYISDLNGQKSACDNLINSINNANYGVPTYIGEYTSFGIEEAWTYVMDRFNTSGWHYTTWSYKTTNYGSWGIYDEKTTDKVNPTSDSIDTIKWKWGPDSIGTGAQSSSGMIHRVIGNAMPGTVVFADTALTNDSYFSIKATINSKYVCADNYGETALVADRDSGGEWEQFRVVYNGDGTVSFQSRANNKYLCAVFDDSDTEHPIVARSNQIGTWEKFYIEKQADGTYALRTYENNYYVQADINDATSGKLHACATSVGTWETFTFEATNSAALPNESGTPPTTQAPDVSNAVNCPGSFTSDKYSSKSSEISFMTEGTTVYAGNLVVGSYLEYKVNVEKAGTYTLSMDLATTESGRTMAVAVDGTQVATVAVGVASGWTTFSTYKTKVSFATSGVHTVRITSLGGSCNVANLSFSDYEDEINVQVPSSNGKYGNDFKVVAYYPNWYGDITGRVQWDKITHAYYAFGLPDGNGSGTMESLSGQASNIQAMINACNSYNVVPVLSVGGWSYSDGRMCDEVFALNTNTTAKCQSLAESIVNQAKQYGFKGVDIDWEYPDSSTQAQYTTFMRNLRNLCDQNGMILTVAVAAVSGSGFTSEVLNMLDFVNLMAYDGDGGAGHSPYDLATRSFTYWRDTMGVPANKLVIGVPFYERPNWASYADIVNANSSYAYQDSANINGTTVYYNGIPTMQSKATYAAQNAGGVMIWEISQDTTNADLSLLNAIYNSATAIVGTGGNATVTEIPGTIPVDSYGGKTASITINTSGTKYAGNLNDGSYLDYYIKVPEKGNYTITLKLAAGDAQYNADSMLVKLNDETVATVPIQASTGWETFIDHTVQVTFPAKGTYKLSVVAQNGSCNVADLVAAKGAETPTTKPEEPSQNPDAGEITPGSGDVVISDFVGTYSWGTEYQYQKEAYVSGANAAHKYLVVKYTGDISSLRLERGPLETGEVVWFAQNAQGTFVTTEGGNVPLTGNGTTVVIDLAASGVTADFFNDFHVHTGATGASGSVTIESAWLTSTLPGGTETPTEAPQVGQSDLVVTDIYTDKAYYTGEEAVFVVKIKNNGTAATPSNVKHGLALFVDGTCVNWSDTYFGPVQPGEEVTLVMNYGPQNKNSWTVVAGTKTVSATIDDQSLIEESNENNNTYAKTMTFADRPTEAPTTPVVEKPVEVTGVSVSSNAANTITVTWSSNATAEAKGQKYNVYVDGVKKLSNVTTSSYSITGVSAGSRSVKVTAVLNGTETTGVTRTVTVSDPVKTGDASIIINGYQISATTGGYRTVYTMDDPSGEIAVDGNGMVQVGMLYAPARYVTDPEAEMVIGSSNSRVTNYAATTAGKLDVAFGGGENAQSYSMTMKFMSNPTAAYFNAGWYVRAYAKLKDGTYIYSSAEGFTIYNVADYLYQNLLMNNKDSHDYLYTDVLSIANTAYVQKEFAWNNSIVDPDEV